MKRIDCEIDEKEARVARYVAGRLAAEEREAFQDHLVTCERCRREVLLAAAVRWVSDPAQEGEQGPPGSRSPESGGRSGQPGSGSPASP